jgi:thioredoxin 1
MLPPYTDDAPERAALDATVGSMVVEFGSNGCSICQATQPLISEAMRSKPLPHLRIQDGRGRRLGRSYGITLWPTLVLLRDGREVGRLVRPGSATDITAALGQLGPAA